MFGNDYFQTRQRLKDVVIGVLNLAEKTGAESEPLLDSSITKALNDPFLFTVHGEKKTGKSSFLNALFGCELCAVDSAKSQESVKWYLYGDKPGGEKSDSMLRHEQRQNSF